MGASWQCLRGRCLAANLVPFDISIFASPFGYDLFQKKAHRFGCLFTDNLCLWLIVEYFHGVSFLVFDLHAKMRRNAPAAIDKRGYRGSKLHRRNLERLAERYRGKLHLADILFFMHNRPCLARQVNAGFGQQPELLEIFIILVGPKPHSKLDKNRIARIFQPLHKALCPVPARSCTADSAVFDNFIAWAEKIII